MDAYYRLLFKNTSGESFKKQSSLNVMYTIQRYDEMFGLNVYKQLGLDGMILPFGKTGMADQSNKDTVWYVCYKPNQIKSYEGNNGNYDLNSDDINESVELSKLNDNFWKWFGNSKVVDKKGKPLVVYHGSGVNNIQEFDPSKGFNIDAIYFSDKLSVASHWSGDYLVKKKVQIEETEDVNKLLKTLNKFVKAKIVNYDGYYRLDLKYSDGNESSSPLGKKK